MAHTAFTRWVTHTTMTAPNTVRSAFRMPRNYRYSEYHKEAEKTRFAGSFRNTPVVYLIIDQDTVYVPGLRCLSASLYSFYQHQRPVIGGTDITGKIGQRLPKLEQNLRT